MAATSTTSSSSHSLSGCSSSETTSPIATSTNNPLHHLVNPLHTSFSPLTSVVATGPSVAGAPPPYPPRHHPSHSTVSSGMMTSDHLQTVTPTTGGGNAGGGDPHHYSSVGHPHLHHHPHQQQQQHSHHESSTPSSSTNTSTGTRSLIIHKDERGFGLKVSGSCPVFVAHVTEKGPADRAGVRVGDRIIKVNGTSVAKTDHNQVVQMIKGGGGPFVALTVTPAPPNTSPNSSSSYPISSFEDAHLGIIGRTQSQQQADMTSNPLSRSNRAVSPSLPTTTSSASTETQRHPPSVVNRSVSSTSGVNYYRPGNHQPMIPTHLSEGSTPTSKPSKSSGLSLSIGGSGNQSQSPPSSSATGGNSSGHTPSITSPLPAASSTLAEFEKTKEKTIKAMIVKEKEYLKRLQSQHNSVNQSEEISTVMSRIEDLKKQLNRIKKSRRLLVPKNIFPSSAISSSQTHLLAPEYGYGSRDGLGSTDDLSAAHHLYHYQHGIQNPVLNPSALFWSKSNVGGALQKTPDSKENRKSHSFKDELLLKSKDPILSVESEDECEDEDEEGGDEEDLGGGNDSNEEGGRQPQISPAPETKKKGLRKKSKETDADDTVTDIQSLVDNLMAFKRRHLSSATSGAVKTAKDKITGRRKGPSAVRSSFMSSSSTPEELEWMKESRKLLSLVSYSLNQRIDVNGLLFFGLGSLVNQDLSPDDGGKNSKGRREALFELSTLFLFSDSPLQLKEFPLNQSQMDALRSAFTPPSPAATPASSGGHVSLSSSGQSASSVTLSQQDTQGELLPYLMVAKEFVNQTVVSRFNETKMMGMLSSVTNMCNTSSSVLKEKKRLKEAMRKLLSDALSFEPPSPSVASSTNPFVTDTVQVSSQTAPNDLNLFPSSQLMVANLRQLLQGGPLKGDLTDAVPYSQSVARVLSLLSLFYHLLPHSIFFSAPASVMTDLEPFLVLNSLISSRPGGQGEAASGPTGSRHKSLPSSLGATTAVPSSGGVSSSSSKSNLEFENNFAPPALPPKGQIAQGPGGKKFSKGGPTTSSTSSLSSSHSHIMTCPSFNVMSSLLYCSCCGHMLWGKSHFALTCNRCNIKSHAWCYFAGIQPNPSQLPCLPPEQTSSGILSHLGASFSAVGSPSTGLPLSGPPLGLPMNLASGKSEGGRRSFFFSDPTKVLFSLKPSQSKSRSTLDPSKSSHENIAMQSTFSYQMSSSSSSSLALSSSSSSTSGESSNEEDEEEYVSASSDPSTPILASKYKRRSYKNYKKSKRSKSLEEGVASLQDSSSTGLSSECKSKEYEQAFEEEEKERRLEREKRRKKLKQRRLKFGELISTEKTFGRRMNLLHACFYRPILDMNMGKEKAQTPLSLEELNIVFSNHQQLIALHIEIYEHLKKEIKPLLLCKRSRIDWKSIGDSLKDIFVKVGPQLKEQVAIFCSNSFAAQEIIRAKRGKEKFREFMKVAESFPELDRLKLEDLLAQPFQRIMRYPLLISEVLSTFPPSQILSRSEDPLVALDVGGKVHPSQPEKGKSFKREQEGRAAFETALFEIKNIVQGVNRRKSEFEFLAWFKSKVAPFYPNTDSFTTESIEVVYDGPLKWMINKRLIQCYMILMQDLLVILSSPEAQSAVQPQTTLSTSAISYSTSSSSLAPLLPSGSSTSPSTSSVAGSSASSTTSSSSSFTFSFLSDGLRSLETLSGPYVLKVPTLPEGEKFLPGPPVLEVTRDLVTRDMAMNKTALYLVSPGVSSGSSGHHTKGNKESSMSSISKAAMYELITPSERDRDVWKDVFGRLVDAKKKGIRLDGKVVEDIKVSHSHAVDQQQLLPITTQSSFAANAARIRNRPLPPLPTSTSVNSFSGHDRESHASRMKRSKSQEGNKLSSNMSSEPNEGKTAPSGTKVSPYHQKQASESDLPPVVGVIERVPAREPLNNFSETVHVGMPDVKYAQRITVTAGSVSYANDGVHSDTENYEDVRDDDYLSSREEFVNQQILQLMEERRRIISLRSNTREDIPIDWSSFSLDAFRLELLSLDWARQTASGGNRRENEINELRQRILHQLTLK